MYNSYMSNITFPLGLPKELYDEVKRTASETGLSMADAARQAMKRGLPQIREALAREKRENRVTNVDALPKAVLDKLYADRDDDMRDVRRMIGLQPKDAE